MPRANRFRRLDSGDRILGISIVTEQDEDPDLSWLEQDYKGESAADREEYLRQDRERLEAYRQGEWHMTFIRAEAEVVVNGVVQKISSGGLGGVESDSGRDYLWETEKEQYDELSEILKKMGFRTVPPWTDVQGRTRREKGRLKQDWRPKSRG
jgi:hypothetical protein